MQCTSPLKTHFNIESFHQLGLTMNDDNFIIHTGIYSMTGCDILNYVINAICLQLEKKHPDNGWFAKKNSIGIIADRMLFNHEYLDDVQLRALSYTARVFYDVNFYLRDRFKDSFMKHGLAHLRRYVIHNLLKYKSYQDAVDDAKAGKLISLKTFKVGDIEKQKKIKIDLKSILILLDAIAHQPLDEWDSRSVNKLVGRPLNPVEYECIKILIDEVRRANDCNTAAELNAKIMQMFIDIENSF